MIFLSFFGLVLCDTFIVNRVEFKSTVTDGKIGNNPDPACVLQGVSVSVDTKQKITDCIKNIGATSQTKKLSGTILAISTDVPVAASVVKLNFDVDCFENDCPLGGDDCEFDATCGILPRDSQREQKSFSFDFVKGKTVQKIASLEKYFVTISLQWTASSLPVPTQQPTPQPSPGPTPKPTPLPPGATAAPTPLITPAPPRPVLTSSPTPMPSSANANTPGASTPGEMTKDGGGTTLIIVVALCVVLVILAVVGLLMWTVFRSQKQLQQAYSNNYSGGTVDAPPSSPGGLYHTGTYTGSDVSGGYGNTGAYGGDIPPFGGDQSRAGTLSSAPSQYGDVTLARKSTSPTGYNEMDEEHEQYSAMPKNVPTMSTMSSGTFTEIDGESVGYTMKLDGKDGGATAMDLPDVPS